MRLYNFDLSPYAARCRLVIYKKGLDIELVPPPEGRPRSDAYRAINPIGKVPALVLDDGTVIPESAVIAEYLEERFPEPALLPPSPEARARVRLLGRLGELYVLPALRPLFDQFWAEPRDPAVVEAGLSGTGQALDHLEHFTAESGWVAGPDFSLADCALMPVLFVVRKVLAGFGEDEPLQARPRLRAWWQRAQADPLIARVTAEMEEGLRQFLASR